MTTTMNLQNLERLEAAGRLDAMSNGALHAELERLRAERDERAGLETTCALLLSQLDADERKAAADARAAEEASRPRHDRPSATSAPTSSDDVCLIRSEHLRDHGPSALPTIPTGGGGSVTYVWSGVVGFVPRWAWEAVRDDLPSDLVQASDGRGYNGEDIFIVASNSELDALAELLVSRMGDSDRTRKFWRAIIQDNATPEMLRRWARGEIDPGRRHRIEARLAALGHKLDVNGRS